ncbi:MAG: hypothetical protein ACXABY_13400 [Candidatus Thorarchaeota archaeon]|jgi:hypothetical protein
MRIRTIEENFEWQMALAIRQVFEANEEEMPEDGDELESLLMTSQNDFATTIIENMGNWTSWDDWLEQVKEK